MNSVDILRELQSEDSSVRDSARASLQSMVEARHWEVLLKDAHASNEEKSNDQSARCLAILRQECLEWVGRVGVSRTDWIDVIAKCVTEPSILSQERRVLQEVIQTVLTSKGVSKSAQREFVVRVFSRGAGRSENGPLLRVMARVARGMTIREARADILELLSPERIMDHAWLHASPELLIDLLQAIARVGQADDIRVVAYHLDSDSPGVAQSAFDAIVSLSDDRYALSALLFESRAVASESEKEDALRAALSYTRFVLPRLITLPLLAWVLRREKGPRTRASLIDVIARIGGASSLRVLIWILEKAKSREERERLRSAMEALGAGRMTRAWKRAWRSTDLPLRALAWRRLARDPRQCSFALREAQSRWPGLPIFLKLALLEAAAEIPGDRAREMIEKVRSRETGLLRMKAQQALAARSDVQVDSLIALLESEQKTYGRSEVLIELSENQSATNAEVLGRFCLSLEGCGPALVYAKARALVRTREPRWIASALFGLSATTGVLRERLMELLSEAWTQGVLPVSELERTSEAGRRVWSDPQCDRLWSEVLERLVVSQLNERQWSELLLLSGASQAIRGFVAKQGWFWKMGARGVVSGFMDRERFVALKGAMNHFKGIVDEADLSRVQHEMSLREGP